MRELAPMASLLKQNETLFAGGTLSEEQKDMFFEAVSRAYFMNKQHARVLYRYLGIQIDNFSMGSGRNALKDLITRNSRCATITINSNLSTRTQDLVIFHEIWHYTLTHHTRKQICAFHDYGVFDNSSELEDEANRFITEYLLEDSQTFLLPCFRIGVQTVGKIYRELIQLSGQRMRKR